MSKPLSFTKPPVPADLVDLYAFTTTAKPHEHDILAVKVLVERIAAAEAWIAEARPMLRTLYNADYFYLTNCEKFLEGPSCYDKV